MRNLVHWALFPLLVSGMAFAFRAQKSPLQPDTVSLPQGKPAWVVRVTQSGGLLAESVIDITVNSSGDLKCLSSREATCDTPVSDDVLQAISQLALKKIPESKPQLGGACTHCLLTRITLNQRDSRGKVSKYFAYWDALSAGQTSKELVQLARVVLSLSK